jgi:hypothetical protein
MEHLLLFSGIAAVLLAINHLLINQISALRKIPRSKWLSIAGGISVAYIFIHVLPELKEWQEEFTGEGEDGFIKHHMYLVALVGLAVFYGVERAAKMTGPSRRKDESTDSSELAVFWVHIVFFAFYNLLIGFLLVHRDTPGLTELALFTIAMVFHFAINDHGLHDHYAQRYRSVGRWVLSVAVLLGWLIGALIPIAEVGVALMFAFIGGGTILNTLKEELPEERKSNYWAFIAGIIIYTLLLLLIA